MPRGLSSQILTAIAADTVKPVYLAYFDFNGGAIRTWTGEGDLSYDSQTWSGDGRVSRWPVIAESMDLIANNISLELSAQHSYAVDITDPAKYRARTCEIYIGFIAADGTLPATNVVKLFSGRMAELSYTEDAAADAYTLKIESRLVDLQKIKVARYTHQTQLNRFASDAGLEYAANAQAALFISRGETPDQPFARKVIYGEAPVEGAVVFVGTSGSGSRYLNLVVAFADHECQSIEQLYLDDRAVLSGGSVAGEFVGVVNYYAHLGTDSQTVDTNLQTEVTSTVWTNNHRLRGICYAYLRIQYSQELFGDAAPRVSARIKGKKIYDPRSTSTAWSDNAALVVRDFLLSETHGFSSGSAEVNDSTASVAANDCDVLVDRADTTQEKRYTINGVLDTTQPIGENLKILLNAMAGHVSYLGGVFSLFAGSYALTSLVVGDEDLQGEIQYRNRNLREAYNGARGLYKTAALDWQEEEYPSYANASAQTADGEDRWLDLPLPLTTSAARCQRIAKIMVMRSRATRSLTLRAKLSQMETCTGDVISISTTRSAIDAVVYEIRAWRIVLELLPRIELDLLEVAAADYAWDESTEEIELTVPEEPADSIIAWTLARLTAPSATPGSKTFTTAFNATVSHNETGVTCYYTTDGSAPTESDSTVSDGGTVAIGTATTTLKLKTFENSPGTLESEVVTYEYTYDPPTVLVPTPVHRFDIDYRLQVSDLEMRHSYAVVGLGNTTLKNSENGGSTWSTLKSSTDDGTYYVDNTEITSANWTPSNFRAYATKAGYLDSNQFIVPNQCIIPAIWAQEQSPTSNNDRIGIMNFATNGTIYYRYATKSKSGGGWSSWSSWASESSLGWRDYFGTQYPYKTLETEFTWYKYEVYCAASGFTDSIVMYINAQDHDIKYGGESGVLIDPSYSVRQDSYS